jgi:RNA polymerase sigma-70 factor (ECF subfamily)
MERTEFAQRYESVYGRLWLVAAGLIGDRTEADDIVQEAAIIAFRKRDEFRPGSNFAAWLTEIVKNCAANHKRKSDIRRTFATDPRSLDLANSLPSTGGPVDALRDPKALNEHLDDDMFRALNQLSPDARCCLLLRVVQGSSYAEIAHFLNIPEGTAMSHVHRSKQLIRRQLRTDRPSEKQVDR